jgi:hypothetical protein
MTVWKTVEFGRDIGIQHVIVKGDALKIVHALRHESCCWSLCGQFIDDVRTMLNSFQSKYVGYVNKETNEATH